MKAFKVTGEALKNFLREAGIDKAFQIIPVRFLAGSNAVLMGEHLDRLQVSNDVYPFLADRETVESALDSLDILIWPGKPIDFRQVSINVVIEPEPYDFLSQLKF